MIQRVAQMATSLSNHITSLITKSASQLSNNPNNLMNIISPSRDDFLKGIHVSRIHDQTELIAFINTLENYLISNNKIKLIVIDSIAFHFRQALQDLSNRSRMLTSIIQILNKLAYNYQIAIVGTNHVTTKIDNSTINHAHNMNSIHHIIPALGEQWSHCITNRIMLQFDNNNSHTNRITPEHLTMNNDNEFNIPPKLNRQAMLVKSPSRPIETVNYVINQLGIRDQVSYLTKHFIELN